MALWFLRGLRRGIVTTGYPRRTDEWAHSLPSPPSFDSRVLTPRLVDRLEEVCPNGSLRREGGHLLLDVGSCTMCGACENAARHAVVPSGSFELSATERQHLIKRIPIEGSDR